MLKRTAKRVENLRCSSITLGQLQIRLRVMLQRRLQSRIQIRLTGRLLVVVICRLVVVL